MSVRQIGKLMVHLAPGDMASAQVAGVRFARSLAGAPTDAFLIAVSEQEALLRLSIQRAGFSLRNARVTAGAFGSGARLEWGRLAPRLQEGVSGQA